MRKLLLAGCLALGASLGLAELNPVQADHGRSGYYRSSSCNRGYVQPTYRGYSPYAGRYASPGLSVRSYYPVSPFGNPYSSPYGRSYGNYGAGYGGYGGLGYGVGYGNLGYGSAYSRTLPRVQLRIGF